MKKESIVLMLLMSAVVSFAVPPAPGNDFAQNPIVEFPSEIFGPSKSSRTIELPQKILVLLADFEDRSFDLVPDFPDSVAHDRDYFLQIMEHMSAYFKDVSHGNYVLEENDFFLPDTIFTLPNTMAYYGDDDNATERICELIQEVVSFADPIIDFNEFDAIIIFHAGAGQESKAENVDALWTTFVSRRTLQAGIDPENNDFPGIETEDDIFLKEFVICPESEWHDNNTPDDTIYGLLGIVVHQFGHQLGLPTLFDNDSSNGSSAGIGSFGLMGTGVWNANGYVPPLPCAWSRYYLGWEDDNLLEINSTGSDFSITFPQADDADTKKLYKIPISEKEYFLVENRQQNPDGSYYVNTEGDTTASFTFKLLPEGEQDYYPADHPNAGQPKFNFMENTYEGCEWDFYLPGYGTSDTDGSGILIWHIDENIIDAKFDSDFEINQINADAEHKGVDLEEADGTQQLDHPYNNIYAWGSPFDSYRAENNDYFGKRIHNGEFVNPTAESYYGGIQLEIHSISAADSLMTFSVNFEWSLNASYLGENPFPAAVYDCDEDNENEIFYPMLNGDLYTWKDSLLIETHTIDTLANFYAIDKKNSKILIPYKVSNSAKLFVPDVLDEFYINMSWAAPIMINPTDETQNKYFLALNSETNGELIIYNEALTDSSTIIIPNKIATNMMWKENIVYLITENWNLVKYDLLTENLENIDLEISEPKPQIRSASLITDFISENEDIVLISDSLVYCYEAISGDLAAGFPIDPELNTLALPSFADLDNNGKLEILLGGENDFAVISHNGKIQKPNQSLANPDSIKIAAGVIAYDIDDDGQLEILGNMSGNRFCIWENINNNDFELKQNYPVTFGERSMNFPIIADYSDIGINAFIPSNNGTIYKISYPELAQIEENIWNVEYANLQRTASILMEIEQPPIENEAVFNSANTYIYPNPLSKTFSKAIDHQNELAEMTAILRIETFQDCQVKIKIFDIALNRIFQKNIQCEKNVAEKISIDASRFSSGVYFVILNADGETKKMKFAIEK